MGALDDAIRDHLDLKRRQGASDDELKRKEDEAFGKAQFTPPPESEPAPASPSAEGQPAAGNGVPASMKEEPEPAHFAEPVAEPPAPPERDAAPLPVDELDPDEVLPEDSLEPGPAPEPAAPDSVLADLHPYETGPHRTAEELPSEDVLEDTPEFLEETPEQDRLWFEQKPPKDFDFDD